MTFNVKLILLTVSQVISFLGVSLDVSSIFKPMAEKILMNIIF